MNVGALYASEAAGDAPLAAGPAASLPAGCPPGVPPVTPLAAGLDTATLRAELAPLGHTFAGALDVRTAPWSAYAALDGWDAALCLVLPPASACLAAWSAGAALHRRLPLAGNLPATLLLCADRLRWRAVARAARVPLVPALSVWAPSAARLPPVVFPVEVRARQAPEDRAEVAWNRADLRAAAARVIAAAGAPALAERRPTGRTFAVALLGDRALPPLERAPGAAWTCPARVPPPLAGTLGMLARKAATALSIDGPALLRFLWDGQHQPRLVDPDARPPLAAGTPLALAAEAAGMTRADLWQAVLRLAAGRALRG